MKLRGNPLSTHKMKLPKIMTEKEREEKEKKDRRLMTIIIVVVLMASIAAFALTANDQSETVKYNGFSFIKTDSGWQVKKLNVLTTLLPNDVENLTSPQIDLTDFKNNIYFLVRTNAEQTAANELNRAFYGIIEKAQAACSEKYENDSFCNDLPIKNCKNETSSLIIEIDESENQSIEHENNCIIIRGNEIDLLRSADKIIYSAYGIINS